jgi:hypothetical protein
MKNSMKLGAGASLAFIFTGLLANGTIASAAPAVDCGPAVNGVTPTTNGDYCQYIFNSAAQSGPFIVPAGLSALQAVLVGAGGGGDNSYSGNGGAVSYLDLTEFQAGTSLDLEIGLGGSSNPSVEGTKTEIRIGPAAIASALGGGFVDVFSPLCFIGDLGFFSGIGAANVTDIDTCEVNGALGVYPGDDPNSPSLFKNMASEGGSLKSFGNGGIAASLVGQVPVGPGWGAPVLFDGNVHSAGKGSDGAVFLRYTFAPVEEPVEQETLAETGTGSSLGLAGLAFASSVVGAVFVLASRRRKNNA